MRLMGQDCICGKPPYPDCFGCLVSMPSIPQTWQLDFPTAMEYQYVDSGSYTRTTSTTTSLYPPWQRTTVTRYEADYTFPDLSTLGVPSILEIDDAPLANSYGPYIQCIWASNEFVIFEAGRTPTVRGPASSPCPVKGSAAFAYLGAEYTGSNAWTYNGYLYTPPNYSYNRQRTALSTTDYRCGTSAFPGCFNTTWYCDLRPYGVFALLTVVQSGASYILTVTAYWWPRLHYNDVRYYYNYNPLTGVTDGNYIQLSRVEYTNILSIPNIPEALAAFPSCTAVANLSQGAIIRYTKTVSCPGDFTGSPVTLTKAEEYKAHAGASQTIVAAAGIVNVPSTVTITPV